MFERFTDRARRAVVLAQEESRALNHSYIGTEHLLLGLLHESEGIAAQALASLGVRLEAARAEVEDAVGRGEGEVEGHIPFTPRAKKVLEYALREALHLNHDYLGTEHILLGLLREGDGIAVHILVTLDADPRQVRQKVLELLDEVPPVTVPHQIVNAQVVSRAVKRAVQDALRRGQDRVGSEHLMLWILNNPDSGAVRALQAEGVDLAALEARLERTLEEGNGTTDP